MGGDLFGFGLDLVERLHDRGNAACARARAVGAHAELNLVGVAVHDADLVERHAEPIANDLGKGRLVALAMLVTAGEDFHRAERVPAELGGFPEPDAAAERANRLARRDSARLDIGGKADAAQLAVPSGFTLAFAKAGILGNRQRVLE